ncbi:tyrosine--tRNA ligase [Candidatus Uhrbacteria bacterium]|nr:tyrosine--tRNA ligase [Candidatus Uhrbacteria bacterium]
MKVLTDPKKIKELLTRGVDEVVVLKNLEAKLKSGKQLRVKHGVDPTTPDLHLGYSVVYRKLRVFQELGHKIIFLIGGFTARFGDPTARLETRMLREKKEVAEMAKNYLGQAGKILDMTAVEVRDNSEWYDSMSAEELLRLLSEFTKAQMEERDMFREREKAGLEVRLHELTYPALQGYDSVMLKSDLTVVGSDQLFNELQARPLQKSRRQIPQDVMTMKLLIGTDGTRKMSQSLGNFIGLTEKAESQYGKIMSIPDSLILQYFELCTDRPMEEIKTMAVAMKKGANPADFKARLARSIVEMYHGPAAARSAEKHFDTLFRAHELPAEISEARVRKDRWNIAELLVETKLASSKSEARRLIDQGGIKADGHVLEDAAAEILIPIQGSLVLQRGKRQFMRVRRG